MNVFTSRAAKLLATVGLAGLVTAGCASTQPTIEEITAREANGNSVTLTVWTSQQEQASEDAWLPAMERAFQEAHPEYDVTFNNAVVPSSQAATTVAQDPAAAADVFMFANDQLGALIDAGAIGQNSTAGTEQVIAQNDESIAKSVADGDGNYFGVPVNPNTWFMYYNTDTYSPEDITSLEKLLEKGVVSFPLSNSWYLPAFYVGAGGTIFGEDGTDAEAGIDLGDNAAAVTRYLVRLANNPNFSADIDGSGLAGFMNGSVDVVFTGSWDADSIDEALGDSWGVAPLPTFNVDGQDFQMKAFAGSTAVGYNTHTLHPKIAADFTAFLGSAEAQLAHYQMGGALPSDASLADNPEVASNPVATAQLETIEKTSVLQPAVKEMANFWTPAETFGKALVNGEITEANAQQRTEEWLSAY